ncbi:MAG: glycosyl hydrolase family 28 protein [Bacteroidota bacterium]
MKKLKLLLLLFLGFLISFKPPEKLNIFLIGDSTCANKNPYDAPETGWGQVFATLFSEAAKVQNHAVNGRSTKSFRNEGKWKVVYDQLKKGDYVFIQFGHNDAKISDTTKYAPAQTDYRANLIRYVKEVQEKGGIPILLTPVMRRNFVNDSLVDTHADYPIVVREVSKQLGVTLIDLHKISADIISKHGENGSKKMFMHHLGGVFPKFPKGIVDNTHFSPYGAALMANAVANEIDKQALGLRNFLTLSEFDGKFKYELPVYSVPYFKKDTFNISRFGAIADGKTLNSPFINQTIDACAKSGGGTVLIPKGIWLSGPIVMQSNVNLHIAEGALLQFSKNYDDFPIVITSWEGQESYRCQPPIWGKNLENIGITGSGTLDGAGEMWGMIKKEKQTPSAWSKLIKKGVVNEQNDAWYPTASSYLGSKTPNAGRILNGIHPTEKELKSYKDYLRPNMISLFNCQNILIEGITLQNSPAWTMHPLLCEHISVKNVTVRNTWYAPNSDAIDLESCRNGIVEGCSFDTGDDGITIKSGRDEQGRKRGVPTENFIIKNNKVYRAHGGFVIGSEMSGGVRNMYISDCTFMGTDVGLRFKTARGRGGTVENIFVNNINMTQIPGEAIIFDMYYAAKDPVPANPNDQFLPIIQAEPLNDGTPTFRNFQIKNIICKGAETGILIRGLPESKVKNISIENAYIESNKGIVVIEAEQISLKNITNITESNSLATIQNAKNIVFDNIKFSEGIQNLLNIQGKGSNQIKVLNTNHKIVKEPFVINKEVSNKALSFK